MTAENNLNAYEANLEVRLKQLQDGDKAYEQHALAIIESIMHANDCANPPISKLRLLDVGCGLGFLSARLAMIPDAAVVGIDPLEKAIELARLNHPTISFYQSRAEELPEVMTLNSESHFDHAILNMVLHSVDDNTVRSILSALKGCLVQYGVVHLLVPTQRWLLKKLVDVAQDRGMTREKGLAWIEEQLELKEIELPIKISGREYWPEPITVHNRTLDDYADILFRLGYGWFVDFHDEEHGTQEIIYQPFWIPIDYYTNYEMSRKERVLLMSQVLEK